MLLLTTVSGMAMLTGCSLHLLNPFSGERPKQEVENSDQRRLPVYNTVDMENLAKAQKANAPAGPAPSVAENKSARQPDNFDYYGAAAGQAQAGAASSGSLGTLNPAPSKTGSALMVRKPLPQNIYTTQNNVRPAQVASLQTSPAPISSSGAVPPQPKAEEKPQQLSFFDRMIGSDDGNKDALPPPWKTRNDFGTEHALAENEKNAPYAPLSTVPESPTSFKSIKASRDQDIEDLQNDRAYAEQQKHSLENEPSQQQPATPVEMPQPSSAPATTAPAAVNPPVAAQPPAAEQPGEPRKPRRGIDIMTQEEWDALQKEKALQRSQAAQPSPPPADFSAPPSGPVTAPAPAQAPDAGGSAPPSDSQVQPLVPNNPDNNAKSSVGPQSGIMPGDPGAPEKPHLAEAVDSAPAPEPKMEVAEHRSSFFDQLFAPSHDADGVKTSAKAAEPPVTPEIQIADAAPAQPVIAKAKPEAQKAESSDWLQALISDSRADTIDGTETLPKPQGESAGAAAAALPPPVQASHDLTTPKLIGEMSDKAVLQLSSAPAPGVSPPATEETISGAGKPAAAVKEDTSADYVTALSSKPAPEPAPPATPAADTPVVAATAAPTVAASEVKPAEEQASPGSFWSRLFGHRSASAAPDETAVAAPERPAEPAVAEKLPSPKEEPVANQAAAQPPAATENEEKAQTPLLVSDDSGAAPIRRSPFTSPMAPRPQDAGASDNADDSDNSVISKTAAVAPVEEAPVANEPSLHDNAAADAPRQEAHEVPAAQNAPQSDSPGQEHRSFWNRLFSKSPQPAPEEAAQKEPPKDEPQEQPASGDAQPVPAASTAAPSAAKEDIAPDTAAKAAAKAADTPTAAAPLPSISPSASAAPVAAVTAGDGADSLPSPKLLEQVKMMPVSRYSARMQAAKPNPDDN